MIDHLVLMFAYHYPPENVIGAARPARFVKYLSRLGYTCRIFTAAQQAHGEGGDVEYVPDPFVTGSRRSIGWQFERVVRKAVLPSAVGIQWSYYASHAARAYLRAHPASKVTIFSTFPPLGVHFAAWQLVRNRDLRWIADFRDPLAHEWTQKVTNPFQTRIYRRLEAAIARGADVIIANTDAARARWLEKYPSAGSKTHVVWNGFDPDNRIYPLPIPARDHKLISHVGELYLGRSVAPILKSFARLIGAGKVPAGSVRVRLIGPAEPECLPSAEFVRDAQNQGWLEIVNAQLPLSEARHLAQTSDGLLLVQPQSGVQVPAKIFDYLQIGRPILAFLQPNSPSERILEGSRAAYRVVYPDSSLDAIDSAVAGFLALPSTPRSPEPWFQDQFNAERQTQALDGLIRTMHTHDRHAKPLSSKDLSSTSVTHEFTRTGGTNA